MSTEHVVPCSTDSCSDTMSVVVQTANKENTPYMSQAVAYSRLKKKKLARGLRVEKSWCLDSWSLMGGGRLWEVVSYGRWTLTRGSYHKALSRKILAFG